MARVLKHQLCQGAGGVPIPSQLTLGRRRQPSRESDFVREFRVFADKSRHVLGRCPAPFARQTTLPACRCCAT